MRESPPGKGFLNASALTVPAGQPEPGIIIDADFPRGSLGSMRAVAPGRLVGAPAHWPKRDGIGDQCYFFYFRIDGVRNRTLAFELENLTGTYRGGPHHTYTEDTRPVVSYDNQNWKRVTDVAFDPGADRFSFSYMFTEDTAWLAYAHPFTPDRYAKLQEKVERSPLATLHTLGQSAQGRPIHLIDFADDNLGDRRTVLINALQHSGEDAGGYFVEGLIDRLLSDDPAAEEARDRIAFKIVPVMNPDGMHHGITRYTSTGEDLNTQWRDPAPGFSGPEPEVACLKAWIDEWYAQGRTIDVWIDVHNNSQRPQRQALQSPDNVLAPLAECIAAHWPIIPLDRGKPGAARNYGYQRYGMPAGNFELSQSRIGDGPYLDIEDYRRFGADLPCALLDYFAQ